MLLSTCPSVRSLCRKALLLAGLFGPALSVPSLLAQATAPAVALGNVNLGTPATATVTFTFSASTTVATVSVVTQGATGKDFQPGTQLANACKAGTYAANASCTVVVQFKPLVPGVRLGAAVLLDGNSNKLASGTVAGVGVGGLAQLPLAAAPTVRTPLPAYARAAAYDGAGNLFVLGQANPGTEIKTDGSTSSFSPNLPTGDTYYLGLAIDGAGYLYVPDSNGTSIVRIDPVTLVQTTYTGGGLTSPTALAFDPSGTLFAVDYNGIEKISGSGAVTPIYAEQGNAIIGLAFDTAGNLYYGTANGGAGTSLRNSIYKVAAGQTTATLIVQVNSSVSYSLQSIAVDAASNIFYSINPGGVFLIPTGVTGSPGTLLLSTSASPNITTLSGTGTFAISLDTISVTQYNRLAQSLSTANSTATALGSKSPAQSVTVENDGNAALTPTAITGKGAANSSGYTCAVGTPVSIGGTCTLGVQFAPTTTGSPQTGTLTLTGNTLSPVVSIKGYVAGDPVSVSFSTPPPASLQNGGNAGTVKVAVLDNAGGATTSTASVTLTVTGSNSYSQTYTANAVSGTATFNLSGVALATGSYTYTAASSGLTSATATETVYPYKLIFTTAPATPLAAGGNGGTVSVAIQDNSGNATTQTSPVTLTVTGPGSYSASYGPVTPSSGTATFNVSAAALTTSGTYTYTATSPGLTTATASEVVTPGPATQLTATPSVFAGYAQQPVTITVRALDQYGNVATSDADTVSLTASPTTATLPANFALASGAGSAIVKFTAGGTYTVTVQDATNSAVASGVTGSITIKPLPLFTVTTLSDDATATAGNCTNQALSGATPDAACHLRDAVAAANAIGFTGNTGNQAIVNFAPALYTNYTGSSTCTVSYVGGVTTTAPCIVLSASTSSITLSANVSIAGPGPALLAVSGNGTHGIFSTFGNGLNLSVSGLTLTGGAAATGGAFASTTAGNTVAFTNDVFYKNSASAGGAVYLINPSGNILLITNSTFDANTVTANASAQGGALYLSYVTYTIVGSSFSNNSASSTSGSVYVYGGAIYTVNCPPSNIRNSSFIGNLATSVGPFADGGALYSTGGSGNDTFTDTVWIGNTARGGTNAGSGGALYYLNKSQTLVDSLLQGNTATTNAAGTFGQGGAIYSSPVKYLYNTTVTGNFAKAGYGGVYGTVLTFNSIVYGNSAGSYADMASPFTTVGSLINFTTGSNVLNPLLSVPSNTGPSAGPAAGAGAYTAALPSMIPLPGSPALRLGSISTTNCTGLVNNVSQTNCLAGQTTDLRGQPRTLSGNVDAGATEANYSLLFVQQPANIETSQKQISTVQLYESGLPFAPGITGGTLARSDAAGLGTGTLALSATGLETLSETYSSPTTGDTLTASVPTSGGSPIASVTSAAFDVVNPSTATLASLRLSAYPAGSPTGIAQSVTVTALDSGGAPYAAYTGTVTFTSSDAYATLPASYTFTAADAGVHNFSVTLNTAGTQSVTAQDGTYTATQTVVTTGYVWLVNPSGSLTKDYANGTAIGNYTGGGTPTNGLAFDSSSNAWSLDKASSLLVEFDQAGTALSGSGFTGGGLSTPNLLAIDGKGQVWVTNNNGSLSLFSTNNGSALSPNSGFTGITTAGTGYAAPTGIAIDASGNVWVANSNNTLMEVLGGAAPAAPLSTALTNNTTGARP